MVGILLTWEVVNPDKPNHFGQTLLLNAASGRYEEVMEVLLGQKDDKADNFGQGFRT